MAFSTLFLEGSCCACSVAEKRVRIRRSLLSICKHLMILYPPVVHPGRAMSRRDIRWVDTLVLNTRHPSRRYDQMSRRDIRWVERLVHIHPPRPVGTPGG